MLRRIDDVNAFKNKFNLKFTSFRLENSAFNNFLLELLIKDTAYVVGGFLRDIINDKESRDVDIIVDTSQARLEYLLKHSSLNFSFNRMAGVKIILKDFEVDMWTIDNNWAFRSQVVKQNGEYILGGIGDGCFYNYDSLVINLHKNNNLNIKNYNECVDKRTLDILKKNDLYKTRNPTIEANILRALFVSKKFDLKFSDNCLMYLAKNLLKLKQEYGSSTKRLDVYLNKYEKYRAILNAEQLEENVAYILRTARASNDKKNEMPIQRRLNL